MKFGSLIGLLDHTKGKQRIWPEGQEGPIAKGQPELN